MKFRIRVPATTANLGAGVDCLGAALSLYLTVRLERADEVSFSFDLPDGPDALPEEDNLILRAMRLAAKEAGRPLPPFRAEVRSDIPLGRGLGSSASAAVAGLLGGFALLRETPDEGTLLRLAAALEGHPDNAAPALLGGFTAAMTDKDGRVFVQRIPSPSLKAVVAVPDFELSTRKMREALPEDVPLKDATRQLQRACVFCAALAAGDFAVFGASTKDRLFTPARKRFMPYFDAAEKSALVAGALCAVISGAGPTMLALAKDGTDANAVKTAWEQTFPAEGVSAKVLILDVDKNGALCRTEGETT